MPEFHYIANNKRGDSVRGMLTAPDKTELAKQLSAQGLFLVSSSAAENPKSVAASSPPIASPKVSADAVPLPRGKITLKELSLLTRQIAISVRAGMSFVNALERMAQRSRNPVTAFVLHQVLTDVLSGKRFSEALGNRPDIFSPLYVSVVAAGEAGGFLPEALNRVADFLDKEMDLNAKIKSAMVYPFMIALVASVVLTGVMLFIVPTFVKVFNEMGTPLPLPTRLLVSISHFFRRGGFLAPPALIGLLYGLRAWRLRNQSFRRFWDKHILETPLFGKLLILEVITRFLRTLSSLASNGITILQAIGIARQVVQNRSIEAVIDDLYASVQRGNGLSPVLYKSKYFPALVADMVATGESTGAIPEVLDRMADYYEGEVSNAVRDILTMIEPLMIMVMAVIVGLIIAGLMLPMIGLPNVVGQ